jgi:glyoxylase-like metal-dependent hydrolase (beta-lactamase superfamily II)
LTPVICTTCGTQHAAPTSPPNGCRVCLDDRQYVGRDGQQWTTHDELLARLHQRIELDVDLLGIGVVESFAIPQRALFIRSDAGNVMWDCVALVTPEAVQTLTEQGGVDAIAISHPHFYSSMVEWSQALGDVPIHVHAADAPWIARPSLNIRTWSGDELALTSEARLVHCPGHFPGSTVLHWTPPTGRSVLLAGDSLHVAADRRHVSVMHSVPNHVPVGPGVIRDIRRRLAGLSFDDLYGFTWGLNVIGDARRAVDESLDRYLSAITA